MHMRIRLCCAAGVVGLIAAGSGPQSASAQNLQSLIRTLDNVLNPDDARRFEDQARRNHRAEEERYWRDYRAGLEVRRPERGIGPDEAYRFEEQSRRNHRAEEERYWRDYRAGLDGRGRDRDVGPTGRDRGEPRDRFDPTQPR
jgi:hypothetical protein